MTLHYIILEYNTSHSHDNWNQRKKQKRKKTMTGEARRTGRMDSPARPWLHTNARLLVSALSAVVAMQHSCHAFHADGLVVKHRHGSAHSENNCRRTSGIAGLPTQLRAHGRNRRDRQRPRRDKPVMTGPTSSRPSKDRFTKKLMMPKLASCATVWEEFGCQTYAYHDDTSRRHRLDGRIHALECDRQPSTEHIEIGDLFLRPYTSSPPKKKPARQQQQRRHADNGRPIPVTYTNEPRTLVRWLSENLPSGDHHAPTILGFDTESVNPNQAHTRAVFRGPATIQLATTTSSLVLQLVDSVQPNSNYNPSTSCASIIHTLLADPTIVKAGVKLDEDIMELFKAWGIGTNAIARSRLNLDDYIQLPQWQAQYMSGNKVGLKTLAKEIVGVDLLSAYKKSKYISWSNWSRIPLTQSQLYYAGRDAWAGAAICDRLQRHHLQRTMMQRKAQSPFVSTHGDASIEEFIRNHELPLNEIHHSRQPRRAHSKSSVAP